MKYQMKCLLIILMLTGCTSYERPHHRAVNAVKANISVFPEVAVGTPYADLEARLAEESGIVQIASSEWLRGREIAFRVHTPWVADRIVYVSVVEGTIAGVTR